MHGAVRILLVADSHLGFDLPAQPRVTRRRRGHDFLANHAAALEPALRGEVDLVVHGGDVFDMPHVAASVAYQAYAPLLRVAAAGVPVYVVPGNHERSRLPHAHLLAHRNVHVFDRPRTFALSVRGCDVALSGFPYEWRGVRARFPELLRATGFAPDAPGIRLLCLHQCVEGATVGPGNFTFRDAADVIRAADLPAACTAVLSGHIHRQQVLTTDLRGRPLPVPVLYPGSVERTSVAEAGELKGYLVLGVRAGAAATWEFRPLPARPLISGRLTAGAAPGRLAAALRALVADAPADAVLRVRVSGEPTREEQRALSQASLRAFVPASMNVEVRLADVLEPAMRARREKRREKRRGAVRDPARPAPLQLEL